MDGVRHYEIDSRAAGKCQECIHLTFSCTHVTILSWEIIMIMSLTVFQCMSAIKAHKIHELYCQALLNRLTQSLFETINIVKRIEISNLNKVINF